MKELLEYFFRINKTNILVDYQELVQDIFCLKKIFLCFEKIEMANYGYAFDGRGSCRNCIRGCAGNCCEKRCCQPVQVERCERIIPGPQGLPGCPGRDGIPGLPGASSGLVRTVESPRALFDRATEYKGYTLLSAPEGPMLDFFNHRVLAHILSVTIVGVLDFIGHEVEVGNGTSFNFIVDRSTRRFGLTFNTTITRRFLGTIERTGDFWELDRRVQFVRVVFMLPAFC